MRLSPLFERIDRIQRSRTFRIAATITIAAVVALLIGGYMVHLAKEREALRYTAVETGPAMPDLPANATPEQRAAAEAERAEREELRTIAEATARSLNRMLSAKTDPTSVIVGGLALGGLLIALVWMRLGIAVSILLLVGVLAVLPLAGSDLVVTALPQGVRGLMRPLARLHEALPEGVLTFCRFVLALDLLTLAFVVLMQLVRLILSTSHPVIAIARNVVSEAVRIKVSLVFIVLLLFALAALPGLLDPTTPLRYRVQSFLQYGTGGTFWIIAILVLFLAVSSVAFEQRDRVIWQTMTKPVAPWQYLLGKWLGVVSVAAVLLAVSSSGVFLFTEYLRDQRAVGEVRPYVPADQSGRVLIAEDRRVLESQVLAARRSVRPELPPVEPAVLARELEQRVARARMTDPENFRDTGESRAQLLREFEDERRSQFYSIGGAEVKKYFFKGLKEAREKGEPLTLRFRVDVGANDPKALHRFTILVPNSAPMVREVPLGQTMSETISPAAVEPDGTLEVNIGNYDYYRWEQQQGSTQGNWMNTDTMSFPPDGFEVFYPVGTYHANFLRVVIVLWLKLAFLAMVAIFAATFLSFAVASMVAFGTFLIAESAGFLFDSLEYYASTDAKGNVDFFRVVVRAIAVPISRMFKFYADLRPTANLVEGRLVGWSSVALAVAMLGLLTALLYTAGVMIFRRRELATYSGQ